jgi:hypothetical protein
LSGDTGCRPCSGHYLGPVIPNQPRWTLAAGGRQTIISAQGVRRGDPIGPLMFSVGHSLPAQRPGFHHPLPRPTLPGQLRRRLYILGPDDLALEHTLAFFDERQPSFPLNRAKFKILALEDIRANGLRMLGASVGACRARERCLQEKLNHGASTVAKFINLRHRDALLCLARMRATEIEAPAYPQVG